MCGIAGFLDQAMGAEQAGRVVQAMADRLRHRGPDDGSGWVDAAAGVALGHRRLSIVDLSPEGRQPMASACGRYLVAFNGEIYNHSELRGRLEQEGVAPAWRGHSDTEVLLASVAHWGLRGALERSVGMFAVALWDREERTLWLARDRLGEKPLYFARLGERLLFGSELKALVPHPAWRGEIDRAGLALQMRHGYIPAPQSIYKDVSKLPQGHLLRVSRDSRGRLVLLQEQYWSALQVALDGQSSPLGGSRTAAVDELERLISQAVSLQMVADVPVGAFLSGGVDSSTVVALMQAQSTRPVRTFSIGFSERAYDEAEHARAVAQHLGTEHTELYVTPHEAMALIPRLPDLYDEPFGDASQIPTCLVAELARRDVTVALSGDGGDELFYGYRRFSDARRFARLWVLPAPLRKLAAAALRPTARVIGRWDRNGGSRRPAEQLAKAARLLGAATPRALYLDLLSHWKADEPVVLGSGPLAAPFMAQERGPEDFDRWMMHLDLVTFLADDVLTKVDRASMAVSLEARVPLLDHRVVEFAARVPLAWNTFDGRGKALLRQVLYRHVPAPLIDRPKMGFEVPVGQWLRGELRDWAEALLDERRLREEGFFDPAWVCRRWNEHQTRVRNWQHCLWDVLMFQAWHSAQASAGESR